MQARFETWLICTSSYGLMDVTSSIASHDGRTRSPNLTPTILDYSTLASLITFFTDHSFVNLHRSSPPSSQSRILILTIIYPSLLIAPLSSLTPHPSLPLPYQKRTLTSQLHELRRLMKVPPEDFLRALLQDETATAATMIDTETILGVGETGSGSVDANASGSASVD